MPRWMLEVIEMLWGAVSLGAVLLVASTYFEIHVLEPRPLLRIFAIWLVSNVIAGFITFILHGGDPIWGQPISVLETILLSWLGMHFFRKKLTSD